MKNLAPIVLFTYNRLSHTKQTINALKKNTLANKSILYIYSDGYKNESDKVEVIKLREYLYTVSGFYKITIIEQEKNIGLASSIINGVTDIISKYEKVIVLEDDIITSPYFLDFMNNALTLYKKEKKVWNISGWNYPINPKHLNKTFFTRIMNCWGWATWKDRWKNFKKNTSPLIKNFSKQDIFEFNLENTHDFWLQIKQNDSNQINTWAIFWYATIFQKKGLCLNPSISYTHNIGFDNSGSHCGNHNFFNVQINNSQIELSKPQSIEETPLAFERIKHFYLNIKQQGLNKNLIFSQKVKEILLNLENLKSNKPYIIYGAGTGCDLILPYIKEQIFFIIDNDCNKINTQKNTIPIKRANDIPNLQSYTIIISVFSHQEQIRNDLIKLNNIDKENIITLLKKD